MIVRAPNLGRHIFGIAAFAFGIVTLLSHGYGGLDLLHDLFDGRAGHVLVYGIAGLQIFGGVAIQVRRFTKIGAIALVVAYGFFALYWVVRTIASPRTFDLWGNIFEQLSLAIGAAFVYASVSQRFDTKSMRRIFALLLGACTVSFTLRQAFELGATAGFVPKWIPPSQMFWAVATTIAFGLAAVALLANRMTLLATRSMTAMLLVFEVTIWVPVVLSNLHDYGNWGEAVETFAIAATAWTLADVLAGRRKQRRLQ